MCEANIMGKKGSKLCINKTLKRARPPPPGGGAVFVSWSTPPISLGSHLVRLMGQKGIQGAEKDAIKVTNCWCVASTVTLTPGFQEPSSLFAWLVRLLPTSAWATTVEP